MAHEAVIIGLTREQVLGLEAQVSLRGVRLEMDPEVWGKDYNRNAGDGLTTILGQQLPV